MFGSEASATKDTLDGLSEEQAIILPQIVPETFSIFVSLVTPK